MAFRLSWAGGLSAAILVLRAAVASAAPDTAPARDILPLEGVRSPDWISRPGADDLTRVYPKIGAFLSLSSKVRMSCQVATDGALRDCKILDETPAGLGFGDASLSLADIFKMRPLTFNDVPVDGAEVVIPLSFAPSPTDRPPPPDDGAAPDPRRLALGEQLAALDGDIDGLTAFLTNAVDNAAGLDGPGATKQAQVTRAILKAQTAQVAAEYAGDLARTYARTYTMAELRQLVAFYRSPVGRRWTQHRATPNQAAKDALARAYASLSAGTRQALCRQIDCVPEDKAGGAP